MRPACSPPRSNGWPPTCSSPDGLPRFVWTDDKPDPTTYTLMLLRAVAERQRWRAQYDQAKTAAEAVDNRSATGTDRARPGDCPQLGLTR